MKKQLVPKLRFPEFEGEWKIKKTKEIAPLQRGFDLPTTEVIEGEYPVVYSNGVLRKHHEFKVVSPGVITGRSGTIGKVTFVDNNYWPHNTSLWVTDFCGNHPKFIYYFYLNFKLDRYNAGSTVPTLNRNDVHIIKKSIPQLPEQQKIASFLTDVDDKITKLTKKKTLLEQYKKGIMQKIFNQELRFKDDNGNEFPNWKEKKLGDILDYEQPTKYIVESTEYDDSYKIPVLTAGKSFILGYTNETNGIYNKLPVIIFDDFTMANKYVDFQFKVKSSAMKILNPSSSNVNIKFVYEALQMIKYPKGDEHKRFWISEYSKIRIGYPCVEEQTKIANFLSDIDLKIEALNTKIENSKTFKKGLLQKMFV